MFDIEMDAGLIIVAGLTVAGWVGLYFLFGVWSAKGFDPKLFIKLACYGLMPVVSFFVCNHIANKD